MSTKPTEVRAFGSQLLAASKLIGKYCDDVNDEFILCKAENPNPVHCIKAGRRVTECALSVFEKIERQCQPEFDAYSKCLNKGNLEFVSCRKPRSDAEDKFLACLNANKI